MAGHSEPGRGRLNHSISRRQGAGDVLGGEIHRLVEYAHDLDDVAGLPIDHDVARLGDPSCRRADVITAQREVDATHPAPELFTLL